MSTRVKGTLTVTDPTERVLALLFSWLVKDSTEHPPAQTAASVMEWVGRGASHQIGPGLVAETADGQSVVRLEWDAFFEAE
jgi:hypothetical protein